MARHREFFQTCLPQLRQKELHFPRDREDLGAPWETAACRVLLVRLSPFRDVIFSMTHSFLAQEVISAGGTVDYCFLPTGPDRELYKSQGVPLLTGVFTHRDWNDFDLVLFSNAYTLEILNLLPLLTLSGVGEYARSRRESDPLFLLGGANADAVSGVFKPLGDGQYDCFLDGVFFGEGEGVIRRWVAQWPRLQTLPRSQRRKLLGDETPGLWTPETTGSVSKFLCIPQGGHLLTDYPVLNSQEASTARLQISYGCPYFCSFCFEGHDRKPYREVPVDEILAAARELKRKTGARSVDLYSFNFNTHRDIISLLEGLHGLFWDVNFLSQRLDILDQVPGLLEAELAADKRSYTLGIEGISRRQRRFYQKGLDESGLSRLLNRLLRSKIREIKLFYILSGHEDTQDFHEFGAFLSDLATLRTSLNPGVKVLFSFGLLVRMPRTPLSFDRLFLQEEDWQPLIDQTQKVVEAAGFDFRLAFDPGEYGFSQILALGGYGTHELLTASRDAGVWFDRTLGPRAPSVLSAWMAEHWGESQGSEKPSSWTPGLEFLESKVSREFLWKRWQDARQALADRGVNQDPQTCLGRNCLGCRACTPDQLRFLTTHKILPGEVRHLSRLENLVKEKHRTEALIFQMDIPETWAGTGKDWKEAALGRILSSSLPSGDDVVWKVDELLWTREPWAGLPVYGPTLVALTLKPGEGREKALRLWKSLGLVKEWSSAPSGNFPKGGGAVVNRVTWHVELPSRWFNEVSPRFSRYLADRHLPHTLVKTPGHWEWNLAAKALQKKEILEARIFPGWTLELVTGPKADLGSFFKSFTPRGVECLARLKVEDLK